MISSSGIACAGEECLDMPEWSCEDCQVFVCNQHKSGHDAHRTGPIDHNM